MVRPRFDDMTRGPSRGGAALVFWLARVERKLASSPRLDGHAPEGQAGPGRVFGRVRAGPGRALLVGALAHGSGGDAPATALLACGKLARLNELVDGGTAHAENGDGLVDAERLA